MEREAKRKAFEDILAMAKGGMSEALRAKKPKPPVEAKADEKCPECEEGDCEEHGGEEYKSKLAALYEKLTGDEE